MSKFAEKRQSVENWLKILIHMLIDIANAFKVIMVNLARVARKHPRIIITITLLMIATIIGIWVFASSTANSAIAEERAFWTRADRLSLDERTMIKNDMTRTGRVPHLLPWWEMDTDHCAAVAWKFVDLMSGVRLVHGKNGAAWMLRKQNPGRLRTVWDASDRFDERGYIHENDPGATMREFRRLLDDDEKIKPDGLYVIGFRFAWTLSSGKIKSDNADINSHVVVMTNSVFFHMFRYGNEEDPIVADLQERFFSYNKDMQPVWIAEVVKPDGQPFRFSNNNRRLKLEQKIYPWKELRWILAIPDVVPGVNAFERSLLYWLRNDYEMYPRLP